MCPTEKLNLWLLEWKMRQGQRKDGGDLMTCSLGPELAWSGAGGERTGGAGRGLGGCGGRKLALRQPSEEVVCEGTLVGSAGGQEFQWFLVT